MYRVLEIGGREYKVEFTVEASLYNECTEKVTGLMAAISESTRDKSTRDILKTMADIPQTTLTMFYAGLMEHHGEDGDGTIMSKSDAKKLIKQYFKEHEQDDTGNFYGVMELLLEKMADDCFFKQIGLEQIIQTSTIQKVPQDHRKKAEKASGK